MEQPIKNYRRNKIFLLFGLLFIGAALSVIYIFIVLKKDKGSTVQPANPISQQDSFKFLTPAESSKDEIITTLGQPKKETNEIGYKVLYFNSTSSERDNKLYLLNDKLIMVREIATIKDNKNKSIFISKYGVAPHILYGSDSTMGFFLNIYPDKGVAYIGNPNYDLVTEIWYFTPTTFEDFQKNYAPDYKTQIPVLQ